MARILYGVLGQGMGHSVVSGELIGELRKRHDVLVVSADKSFSRLSAMFCNVHEICKPGLVYRGCSVSALRTLLRNAFDIPAFVRSFIKVHRLMGKFAPDVVITDFEPFCAWNALFHGVSLIAVDGQSTLRRCRVKVPLRLFPDYIAARIVSFFLVGFPRKHIILSFSPVAAKSNSVFVRAPVIRKEILGRKPSLGEHVLVYQTSHDYSDVVPLLRELREHKFIVYGANRDSVIGNVILKKFNEKEFIRDIASCRAVITNGGFTLISEAIFLKKPVIAIPLKSQFEQQLNAMLVEQHGFGINCGGFDKGRILKFLANENRIGKGFEAGNRHVVEMIENFIIAKDFNNQNFA